ncbi:Rho-related GTP-binding protein RhoF [Liparis tanakae]|uniref:Rho-related GTP-binding protein RhoF n=1 Tax=Liparis tanakae TaxID=230148 RepID=A0A4Z2I7L4_9TELE|nr:Rho-related GTP-binding protein RhoF [Liparis tanakae]
MPFAKPETTGSDTESYLSLVQTNNYSATPCSGNWLVNSGSSADQSERSSRGTALLLEARRRSPSAESRERGPRALGSHFLKQDSMAYMGQRRALCCKTLLRHNWERLAQSARAPRSEGISRGKEIKLNLYDTAGQEDYDRLRPLSYQEADLILVCFDVTNPTSHENVLIKWHPEVKHFCRDTPVILIGCKTDLRKDEECARKLKAMDQAAITYTQGEETRQQMNAVLYLECSAKHQENVEDVFREATKRTLAFNRKQKNYKRKKICVVL